MDQKLNYKRTIFIGMAFLGISAFWQLYDVIVPLILDKTFMIDKTWTGVIMSLDNVLALFLLPVFGAMSDKVNSRYGRRTPFIFVGTAIALGGILLIPYANNVKHFWIFNIGLATVLLGTAIYRAPAVALMPDLTPKPLRSKANAIINLMGAVGAVLTLIAIKIFVPKTDHPNYMMVFIFVGLVMLVSFVILRWKIDENKLQIKDDEDLEGPVTAGSTKLPKDVNKSFLLILASIFLWFAAYNGITTAYSRYALAMWGMHEGDVAMSLMLATVVAIFSYIPAGIIATKYGRKRTILVGIILVTTTYIMGSILKEFNLLIYIAFAIMGIGWAFINVNSLPMIVEMSKNADIGKFTGTYYTASMSAQILTPILSGFLMDTFGYSILFPYALVFSILSFITMMQVRHGDSKLVTKKGLEAFDVED